MEEEADEKIVDKLIEAMEKITNAVIHVGDTLEELNINIGMLIDIEVRKQDERETNL